MKILILTEDYPTLDKKPQAFVHTRVLGYLSESSEMKVVVLSFKAEKDYEIDGIKVITLRSYKEKLDGYDNFQILISHAPNLRHHINFIGKYSKNFCDVIFFFHGHEVLQINRYYPKPYEYMPQSKPIFSLMQSFYDRVKLYVIKNTIIQLKDKVHLVFVSQWMMDEFSKNINLNRDILKKISVIIYNSVAAVFESENYTGATKNSRDFVTIRTNWDKSKYCIDVVCALAKNNPQNTFSIYGKGEYFKHNEKPDNVEIHEQHLNHSEILEALARHKCALMPSRLDSQGVMACEMVTYGIPLITSDLPVLKEVLKNFDNVYFINNKKTNVNLDLLLSKIRKDNKKVNDFFSKNTIKKEVEFFEWIVSFREKKHV